MDGISFIEEKRCQARTSIAIMTVKMLEAGDFATFLDDVKSEVDAVDNFPDESEMPTVKELGRTQEVITLALTADLTRPELNSGCCNFQGFRWLKFKASLIGNFKCKSRSINCGS